MRIVGRLIGIFVLAAAAWAGWLGWDHEYQVDPVSQIASGPYESWQVVGAALSLVVLLIGALVAGVRPLLAGGAVTLGFTAAWTVDAARADDTGLYGAGAIFLLLGLTVGCAAVSAVTLAVLRRARPTAGPSTG